MRRIYYINKLAKKNYQINVTKHARFEVKWHLCWRFWSSGTLQCIVVTGLVTTNPCRWSCYVPSKLQDMLNYLLCSVTEDQNRKEGVLLHASVNIKLKYKVFTITWEGQYSLYRSSHYQSITASFSVRLWLLNQYRNQLILWNPNIHQHFLRIIP